METLNPIIELLPERTAFRADGETNLRVLVRISAPINAVSPQTTRPRLNLGLVLDRSGSMSGDKLRHAKAAAQFVVEQLGATDRVSLTTYDNIVTVNAPSQLVENKAGLIRTIQQVQAGNTTALHAGWVEGATQVAAFSESTALNRVLLLTDGLANEGETDPQRIAADVKKLGDRGVSTTTLGMGRDFNEDLLVAMSEAGDGNYYFIESAGDLERIFAAELHGLIATWGHTVSLGIEGQNGVELRDVLNEFERNSYGRLQLPNLRAGNPIEVVLTLQIPASFAKANSGTQTLCAFRVAWTSPQNGQRTVIRATLDLTEVSSHAWEALPVNPEVAEKFAVLEVAREREKINLDLQRGDYAAAQQTLTAVRAVAAAAPMAAPMMAEESAALDALEADIQARDGARALKANKYRGLLQRKSRRE